MQDVGPGCCLEALQTAVPRLRASGRQEKKLKNTNSSSAVEWEAGEQRDGMQSLRKRRADSRTTTEYYILSLRRSEAD